MTGGFRYPRVIQRNDYIRTLVGLAICVPMAIVAWGTSFGMWLFLALSGLFVAFGLRTWLRGATEYRLTEDGLLRTNAGLPGRPATSIAWHDLKSLKLRFYPLRRDRSEGWMQLTLRAPGARVAIDSTLEDFETIATAALKGALHGEVSMTPATIANFQAIGISPDRLDGSA